MNIRIRASINLDLQTVVASQIVSSIKGNTGITYLLKTTMCFNELCKILLKIR